MILVDKTYQIKKYQTDLLDCFYRARIIKSFFRSCRYAALFFGLIILFILILPAVSSASDNVADYLLNGKKSLDKGDYEKAISQLTESIEKLPLLSDYALLWRAKAYEEKGDIDKAINDLKSVSSQYPDSHLIKNIRIKEIELLKRTNDPSLNKSFDSFVKDYPSDFIVKYTYALHLKNNGENEKAKNLFRDIYVSVSDYSERALIELSPSDITLEDLIKKGKNLNKAWRFKEAEKSFRDALEQSSDKKIKNKTDEILDGLALSLFRQKRYKEAADLYKKINSQYWLARSLLRAGETGFFESQLAEFMNVRDNRMASVLISYGNTKRRQGNKENAIDIFNNVFLRYPAEKEESLWSTGWTHYLSRDYKKAMDVFSGLYETYGSSKYRYWLDKCRELLIEPKSQKPASLKKNQNIDFYDLLYIIKDSPVVLGNFETGKMESSKIKNAVTPLPKMGSSYPSKLPSAPFERIAILIGIGLRQEAISELLQISRKNPDFDTRVYISAQLKNLGSYKASVNIISQIPYAENLHELFYPAAFWNDIESASKSLDIDPFLILAVMREESRFDPEARSIAGALGLMQLMPQTANRLDRHVKLNLKRSEELYNANKNIIIGSYYLKELIKAFNSVPAALAAYNAGEDAVKQWLKNGQYKSSDEFIEDIPYNETRNYVKKVLTSYFQYVKAYDAADPRP